jgi:hypothetical protein
MSRRRGTNFASGRAIFLRTDLLGRIEREPPLDRSAPYEQLGDEPRPEARNLLQTPLHEIRRRLDAERCQRRLPSGADLRDLCLIDVEAVEELFELFGALRVLQRAPFARILGVELAIRVAFVAQPVHLARELRGGPLAHR